MSGKKRIAILLGDAAGVGAEIVVKALSREKYKKSCVILLIGSKPIFERAENIVGEKIGVEYISSMDEYGNGKDGIYFWDLNDVMPEDAPFATVSEKCGRSCIKQMDLAAGLYNDGIISGFAFAPFNKEAMILAGLGCESEHEYFAKIFSQNGPSGEINALNGLWTSRVTSHIPISEVSGSITEKSVYDAVMLISDTIKANGIKNPRIGVAALNPHCGEGGKCGREEIDAIIPAVKKAVGNGIDVSGPVSSDVLFIKAFDGEYDGVVTMYHDQGQIAMKLKGFSKGVTIAGGIKAPIATCAHGTAFDIAGKGVAESTAFEAAVDCVISMCGN